MLHSTDAEDILEKFWNFRQGLFIDGFEENVGDGRGESRGGSRGSSRGGSRGGVLPIGRGEAAERLAGVGLIGVLEQIRGILLADEPTPSEGGGHNKYESPISTVFDGAGVLALSKLPFMIVQSTDDVFVNPFKASVGFQPEKLPPGRFMSSGIEDCLDLGSVHVSWLKAGRYCIVSHLWSHQCPCRILF